MYRKLVCLLTVLLLVVGLTSNALALIVISGTETWGATSMGEDVQIVAGGSLTVTGLFRIVNGHTLTVEEGGQVVVNARVDFDTGGTLVMNGGTAGFNDTVKFPDNDDGAVYIYLYGGLLTCGDTESYASRGSELHVGGGVMRTGHISETRRDPEGGEWNIQPIPPYEQIIITNLGGNVKEISAAVPIVEVTFALAASGNLEAISPAILTVNLSKAAEQTVTVDYYVSDGTATRDVDYTLADGTLTFVADDTTETISINIIDDGLDEDDETIIVTLTNPTGGDVELGQITEHTYTIIDPRPYVQFDTSSSGGLENATPANIEVGLSWPSTDIVTVNYAVTGGTAEGNGVDYTLENGTLTFEPYETTEYITITIVEDACEEGTETIELTLSEPNYAKLGDYPQHTFTITDKYISGLNGAFYFRADSDDSARIGPYPDVMVRLGDGDDKLIFRRDKGYLPVWYTEDSGEENFSVQITRSNCENTINPFSRVSIIETNPARAIVHWRYARDCSNVGTTGWVDEYFTVYPDGVCMRTVKDAAGTTFAQWDAGTPDIYGLQLLSSGIDTLAASWLEPPALSITSGDYSDEGFNDQRRCYTLQCNVTSDPTVLNATLDTSGGKSIHNPVIVLKNWGDAEAEVSVDGQAFGDCYVGYGDDMYGDDLVVWLGIESTNSVDISIAPSGGSGQFVDRARPPDFGYDFDADVPPLPMGSPEPGPFGAYYTHLKFNNRFDELWRVGDHTDVVVQFDDNAHRFVFWRGANYCPHWVSDTNETSYSNWYGTQFVERRGSEWGLDGCCEPMQDWECRYSHVRIISSNPARAIVQWRYAPCDKHYDIPRDGGGDVWGDWAEEYFTIYPDAISVRKVTAYSSRTGGGDMESPHIEFHEAIPVTNPGTIPEDNIHWNALSATNYNGNKKDWVAQDVDGGAMTGLDEIANKPIMVVRMKGSTVPVSIVEGTSVEHDPVGQHDCRPFNAYDDWPAWPEGDRSMGGWLWDEDPNTHCYRYFWQWYPSHCSILHLKWDDYEHQTNVKRTKVMLFGMFDAAQAVNVNNLIPLARSWENAPALSITSAGFTGGSYDKTERAYKISRDAEDAKILQFTLQSTPDSPIINPCFVVENWWGDSGAGLTVDGQPISPGPDFRQGIEKTDDGVSSLVIWLRKEATSPTNIAVIKPFDFDDLADFCQWWANRCIIGNWCGGWDINQDLRVNFDDFALFASQWLASRP